jgi:transposase-like protein
VGARRHSREFWKRLIAEAEGSSVEVTARRHRVRPGTLQWWKWQLGKTSSKSKPKRAAEAKLLPVVLAAAAAPTVMSPLTIELVSGLTVRVPVGADVQYVAALIAAMRSTC